MIIAGLSPAQCVILQLFKQHDITVPARSDLFNHEDDYTQS